MGNPMPMTRAVKNKQKRRTGNAEESEEQREGQEVRRYVRYLYSVQISGINVVKGVWTVTRYFLINKEKSQKPSIGSSHRPGNLSGARDNVTCSCLVVAEKNIYKMENEAGKVYQENFADDFFLQVHYLENG